VGSEMCIRDRYLSHDSYSTSLFFSNRQAEIVSKSLEELEVLVPGGFYNPDLQDRIIDEIKLEISNFEHTYETNFTIFNQWRKSNDLNMQPAYLTETVVLDDIAYFIGFSSGYYRLLEFDIQEQDLDKLSDYPGKYDGDAKLALHNNYIYVFKGNYDRTYRRYNLQNDNWDSIGVMPFEFSKANTIKIGDELIFLRWGREMYKFSFLTHQFQQLNDFPLEFYYFASLFHYDNKILAATNDQILEYKETNDSWEIFADYSQENYEFGHGTYVFVLNDEIYLFDNFHDSQSAIFKYNLEYNVWTEVAEDPWDTYCNRTWFVHDNTLNVITSGEGNYFNDESYQYVFSR